MTGPERHLRVSAGDLRVVLLADETAVDDAVPVAGHEPTVTHDAREAVHVVDARLRAHDELARRDRLRASGARAARAEHPATVAGRRKTRWRVDVEYVRYGYASMYTR